MEPKAIVESPPAEFKIVERTNDLLKYAFKHPVDFLEHCSDAFKEAVDEISDSASAAEESRLEMLSYVDSIPAMQRIVKKRFAGALCP